MVLQDKLFGEIYFCMLQRDAPNGVQWVLMHPRSSAGPPKDLLLANAKSPQRFFVRTYIGGLGSQLIFFEVSMSHNQDLFHSKRPS